MMNGALLLQETEKVFYHFYQYVLLSTMDPKKHYYSISTVINSSTMRKNLVFYYFLSYS